MLAVAVALAVLTSSAPAQAQDPTVAPPATVSSDGRTVTGAGRTLTVSQAQGLATDGQTVTVQGSGYDPNKGVYVSLCVIPPTNLPPTPCGGGADREGTSGASAWISSNPPDYAAGLTAPYGPGGSFNVSLTVRASISPALDCRQVRCAVVTRNDHTRGSDRSQDLFIPVTFAAPVVSGQTTTTTTTAPPPTTSTTTTTVVDPITIAPRTTLAADGRSVSDGARTVTVSVADDLDPEGQEVTVTGTGFDPAAGIYVALCRVPAAGAAPGPCSAGDGAAWLNDDPPDYGRDLAQPFEAGGAFEVTLELTSVIDADTNCREVACAITTRRDDEAAADRRSDLLVPVAFAEVRATTTTEDDQGEAAVAAPADDGDEGGSSTLLLALGAAVVALAGGALAVRTIVRNRGAGPPTGTDAPAAAP